MSKSHVLIAVTPGDDLMPSTRTPVAASHDRAALERLRDERAVERTAYLAANPIPWWAQYGIVSEDVIETCEAV